MQGYTNSINTIRNYSTGGKTKTNRKTLTWTLKIRVRAITTNKQLRPEMFVRNTVTARGIIQNNTECRSHQRRGRAHSTSVRNNKSCRPWNHQKKFTIVNIIKCLPREWLNLSEITKECFQCLMWINFKICTQCSRFSSLSQRAESRLITEVCWSNTQAMNICR